MKKIILIAMLISANSYAGDYQNNDSHNDGGNGATIKGLQNQWQASTAQSNSDAHANANQYQDANAGANSWSQGGNSSSHGGNQWQAANGGNASNNGGNVSINTKSVATYVPTPGMYGSFSQASCKSSAALGVAVAGIGVGGGIPVKDEVCEGVIASQAWHSLGLDPVACNRLAQDERNAKALRDSGVNCNTVFVKETTLVDNTKKDNAEKDRLFKEHVSK
jgi:hypothetical protein